LPNCLWAECQRQHGLVHSAPQEMYREGCCCDLPVHDAQEHPSEIRCTFSTGKNIYSSVQIIPLLIGSHYNAALEAVCIAALLIQSFCVRAYIFVIKETINITQ